MKFSDIPGHSSIKQRLIRSVTTNRVSHAQLFFGHEGYASLALALAYAQYINCRNRTPEDSCGECPSCKKYNKLIHPDLHFLYPVNKTKEIDEKKLLSRDFLVHWRQFLLENHYVGPLADWYRQIDIEKKQGFISADDADNINQTLAYKAYEAEYKVMIIWLVEKMNQAASNKLLKNLEEPPDKTLFLLITENYELLLKTITSRTLQIKITKPSDDEIAAFLLAHTSLTSEEAYRIAFLADGNLGKALKMSRERSENEPGEANGENFRLFREWMRKCFRSRNKLAEYDQLLETVSEITGSGSREKQKEFLNYALKMLSASLNYNLGNLHLVRQEGEVLEFIEKFSAFVHPDNIAKLEEEFNLAIFHIERNTNATLVFIDLSHILMKLLKPQPARA